MLTETEYAEQQRRLGRRVHCHKGVWWDQSRPFYAKPAFEFRAITPGTARPRFLKAPLGYGHQVPEPRHANRFLEFMILEGEDLRCFSMERLRSEKRNQVRKGLKSCRVERITDLGAYLEEVREINIAQAKRLAGLDKGTVPYTYYIDNADAWRKRVLMEFGMEGREWWGAFVGSQLAAYMITLQVERIRIIQAMKTHTDFLKLCCTDAVYYTVLSHAAASGACDRIVNGGVARESLNRYKEQFLFKRTSVPYYTSNLAMFEFAVRVLKARKALKWIASAGTRKAAP